MNVLRAFLIGALIGFVVGVGMMLFFPIYEGQFPHTTIGAAAAFRAINWFGVWFLTGLFAIGWALYEFRVVRAASAAHREFRFCARLWHLLTAFWR